MIKHLVLALGAILSISALSGVAAASGLGPQPYNDVRHGGFSESYRPNNNRRDNDRRDNRQDRGNNSGYNQPYNPGASNGGDAAIVNAANGRRDVDFVEGTGMIVVQILPDDNQGLRHQKFVVQLSSGQKMLAVYNLDMGGCTKIPLRVGAEVAMGGQFKWTSQGALLHWLHFDPSQRRPDGYVQVNGIDYCRTGQRN